MVNCIFDRELSYMMRSHDIRQLGLRYLGGEVQKSVVLAKNFWGLTNITVLEYIKLLRYKESEDSYLD